MLLRSAARYHVSAGGIEPIVAARWPLGRIVLAIVLYSALRAWLEVLWVEWFDDWTWYVSVAHNYPLYGLVLAFCTPCLVDALVRRMARLPDDPARLRSLIQVMVVLWAVIYPMVPAVSMLTGSPFLRHVELFRYVPGFLVRENFLPSGMFVAIAILLWRVPAAVRRLYDVRALQAWVAVLAALLVIYLVFYQWGLAALYAVFAWDRRLGHVEFFVAYSASFVVSLALCLPQLERAYPEVRPAALRLSLALPFATLLFAPRIGIVAALRTKGWL
jgi:hypothetical protein